MITTAALLFIILVSAGCVRTGSVALAYTGLSKDVASFQSLSAFLGVGFTTSESERITAHPVRRRIVRTLMILGYFGLGSGLVSVISVVTQTSEDDLPRKLLVAITGITAILALVGGKVFDPLIERGVRKALGKRYGKLIHDYAELLRVDKGYSVSNVLVHQGSWMENRTLRQLRLTDEGVVVLSITRASDVNLSTPGPDTILQEGDTLLAYGLEEDLLELAQRSGGPTGRDAHEAAVDVHKSRTLLEQSQDAKSGTPRESRED